MAQVRETLAVDGIHCLQCPPKIGRALEGVEGVIAASATLAGDVAVVYDDAVPDVRRHVLAALDAAGFPPAAG